MINFVHTDTPEIGIKNLADKICAVLKEGKKVLWFISGGSNIPIAVEAMNMIRQALNDNETHTNNKLLNLTVTLSDERYGPVGHKDSNWKQLEDAGFDFGGNLPSDSGGIKTIPILTGKSLEETVLAYEKAIGMVINETIASGGFIIGQFGIGADGHIAGILPHSPATSMAANFNPGPLTTSGSPLVCGYKSDPFTRITLIPAALKKVSTAYVFAFGDSKKEALKSLRDQDLPIDKQPAQILKSLPEAYLYTDM